MHYFNEIKFKSEDNLILALKLTTNALLTDSELPVKVEAGIALQALLSDQEETVEPLLQSQVQYTILLIYQCGVLIFVCIFIFVYNFKKVPGDK